MIQAYKNMFTNYANFKGRTSVKQYWLAFAMNFIIALVLGVTTGILTFIAALISEDLGTIVGILMNVIAGAYSLAILVPFIAMAVRRMHDQNRPGWIVAACYAGSLCCGIGSLVLIVFMCLPGTQGPNQYGDDPNMFNGGYGYNNQFNQYNQYTNQNNQYTNQNNQNNYTGM